MKTTIKKYLVIFVITLSIACSNDSVDKTLINTNRLERVKNIKASKLFSNNYKYFELEPQGANKIGRVNKIVKHESAFYILSDDNRIIHFDSSGNYVSILNKPGKGPTEYTRIEDFNVVNSYNKTQIWLADYSSLKIYDYTNSWHLTKRIKFPYVINKFKVLKNNNILLMTGQNKKSLTLVDSNANMISQYLDKQMPFLIFKPVQFTNYKNMVIFPLGVANEFIYLPEESSDFKHGKYLTSDEFISKHELIEIFQKKEYEYLSSLRTESYINNIRFLKNKAFLQVTINGERFLIVEKDSDTFIKVKFAPNSEVVDDISPLHNTNYLSNFLYGESDSSIIFLQEPESMEDKYGIIEFY